MGVSIQDRTDFLNMLDACRTEQQLFSRLTFAVMFHQTDPDAREDLLDDVRGAACNMQLPAVNYKIDQWLNTCKQAWQADPAAFMAAVNADAKQRKLALEGSAAQPGLLADVPMQSVAWLVPQLLPLGEVSLLGADGGTGKGIWQAQLIAYVTAGKTSGFFPLPPQQTGKVLLHIDDVEVEGVKTARAVFDGYTDKKDADFIEERRVRTAETRQDTRSAILNVLSESRLGSMPSNELRAAVLREIGCSDSTYNRVYSELVKSGEIAKHQINQGGNVRSWFTAMPYRGETSDKVAKL